MNKRTSNIDSSNGPYGKAHYEEHQETYSQDITDVKSIKVNQANHVTGKIYEISGDRVRKHSRKGRMDSQY